MKSYFRGLVLGVTAAALLSVPALAANSLVISDAFSKGTQKAWEEDVKAPSKWDTSENYLSITVGRTGSIVAGKNTLSATNGSAYDVQGKKLALPKPSSNVWTAAVKVNVDSSWFSSSVSRRAAVFRLDMVDADGNPLNTPVAFALEKRSGSAPVWAVLNTEVSSGWSYPKTYTGTSAGLAKKDLEIEEGWHTMYIKCNKGLITYQVDGKILTSFDLGAEAYPSYAALGAADYNNNYTTDFDSFALYNGTVGTVKKILTENEEEDAESSKDEKYRERRARWIASHTEYLVERSDGTEEWVRSSQLTDEEKEGLQSRRVGEEPSWFDD